MKSGELVALRARETPRPELTLRLEVAPRPEVTSGIEGVFWGDAGSADGDLPEIGESGGCGESDRIPVKGDLSRSKENAGRIRVSAINEKSYLS